MVSSGLDTLDRLLGDGYPENSSILVTGQPGVGKEGLAYWFVRSGLIKGDFCLYVTHRSVGDVTRDMKAYGTSGGEAPEWIASSGSEARCDLTNPASISFSIKQAAMRHGDRRVRVATDILSPLLVLNQSESMYGYWSQLVVDLKQRNTVTLALAEEGMHSPTVIAGMESLFDGVIEMKLYEEGLSIVPLLPIRKMLGMPPSLGYFRFSVSRSGMEVVQYVK